MEHEEDPDAATGRRRKGLRRKYVPNRGTNLRRYLGRRRRCVLNRRT